VTTFLRIASLACIAFVLTPISSSAQIYETGDSAGVVMVTSGPLDPTAPSPLALAAEPEITIGSWDGAEPYLFTHVWDALRLPDGRVVVVEGTIHEIRVFDGEGRHEVSFGGRGGGPEEFGGPPWIELIAPDTLLVWDPGHHRISRYSIFGELLEQTTIRERVFELGMTPFPNGLVWATSPEGSLLWKGPYRGRRGEGLNTQYRNLIRVDADGAVDLGRRISGQIYWLGSPDDGFRGFPNSFGPSTFAELGRSGAVWVSDPQEYVVRTYSAGGSLSRVLRGVVPRAVVTDALVDSARAQLSEMSPGLGVPLRRMERAFDEIPVPDSIPAIGALKRGADGRMWVGRRRGLTWTRKPVERYDVFEVDGRWLGAIRLPDDVFKLLHAGEDHVIVAAMDDLGVQDVRVYSIVEGGSR
jgi:hypothetical protein